MSPAPTSTRDSAWGVLALVAVVFVLDVAEDVLMPIALAGLLAFLLVPVVKRIERLGTGRAVAVVASALLAGALLGALAWAVAHQFIGLVDDLPQYRENLLAKLRTLPASGTHLNLGVETMKQIGDELQRGSAGVPAGGEPLPVRVVEPPPNVGQVVRGIFGPLIGPLSTASIVIVFVLFILLQREDLRDRLVRLAGAGSMHATVSALDDAARRVSRYLLMQTLINTVQGTLVGLGLWAIGVPQALMWGALTVALRFIPYLGPVLAATGPIVLATAYFPGWSEVLAVVGLIAILELVSNNVMEPKLYGSSVGVSPFALIVAAVFWTWLWGTAGLFLATPMTVCLVVLGRYIPQLRFLDVLLGDAPALAPHERFYQRLLAGDADEAEQLLDDAVASASLLDAADAMVLPALRLAEHDHERGAIDAARRTSIVEQVAELVDELPETTAPSTVAAGTAARRLRLLLLPAADAADEAAAQVLARALSPLGIEAEWIGANVLKSEMLERARRTQADAICVSAAPPAAVVHARYLCKKLRACGVAAPIVVGLWDAEGDLAKAAARLSAVGADRVVRTAAEAAEVLGEQLQALRQLPGDPVVTPAAGLTVTAA